MKIESILMTSELDNLSELLQHTHFKTSDIEYILKYLEKEEITPELAMRRIKTIDKVMERLEDNREKEEIKHLNETLTEKEKKLTELVEENESLKFNKEDLEGKNALLESENEQLGEQLNSMQEIHAEDMKKEEDKRKTMDTNIDVLAEYMASIIEENSKMGFMLEPIQALILLLKGDKPIKWDKEIYIQSVGEFIEDIEENAVADYN